jgi:hypothetical protein
VVVKRSAGPSLILAPASFPMDAYSARDGEAVWWVLGLPSEMKSTPVVSGNLVYVSGFNTPENDPGRQVALPTWQELLAQMTLRRTAQSEGRGIGRPNEGIGTLSTRKVAATSRKVSGS